MKIFVGSIIVIVFAAILVGVYVVGSPNQARLKRFDEIRLGNLQMIQGELTNYWQAKKDLPTAVEELNDTLRGFALPKDPRSATEYEYVRKSAEEFVLCAVFDTASESDTLGAKYPVPYPAAYPYGPFRDGGNWEHGIGRTCFERTIDPDFFQPPKLD